MSGGPTDETGQLNLLGCKILKSLRVELAKPVHTDDQEGFGRGRRSRRQDVYGRRTAPRAPPMISHAGHGPKANEGRNRPDKMQDWNGPRQAIKTVDGEIQKHSPRDHSGNRPNRAVEACRRQHENRYAEA